MHERDGALMPALRFTFAVSSYDHVQAVVDGRIPIEGAEPLFIRLPIPEMFRRFTISRDWDVSEMGFVQYATLRAGGDDSIVGIPVFTSRLHRHTAIFVRSDRIARPEDLRGSRIGVVAWANSAAVWARGMLSDMHGIRPSEITWYQGGVERPGRAEVVRPRYLAPDVRMIPVADRGMEEMLWSGDLDGFILPSPPASVEGSVVSGGLVRRLYQDPRQAERAYLEKTGCLPIMHMIAIDRALYQRDPGIALRIYDALEASRLAYFARIADTAASRVPVPWLEEYIASLRSLIGPDVWPYGVEANLPSIETALRYLREQGLIEGGATAADIFPEWQAMRR
ncbi:MAG: ABC transporter substrate-binding protein [Burkholderiales bacterium]|nr:ABC transporter substrate-binding protein [Burkholderiales bacterium]